MSSDALLQAVTEKLTAVIDPETGVDVVRMRLIEDVTMDETGKATYIFRPSSPLCPIAVPLALMIIQAVGEVDGISAQSMTVVDYVEADTLNLILQSILEP